MPRAWASASSGLSCDASRPLVVSMKSAGAVALREGRAVAESSMPGAFVREKRFLVGRAMDASVLTGPRLASCLGGDLQMTSREQASDKLLEPLDHAVIVLSRPSHMPVHMCSVRMVMQVLQIGPSSHACLRRHYLPLSARW